MGSLYEQAHLALPEDIRSGILQDVLNDMLGYGPIQPLLDDPEVSEVMVNGAKKVYVEKKGQLIRTEVTFDDDAHVLRIIERIISPLGRHVDADHPTVDGRLPDGSQVNAVVPLVAIDGPSITIRKFRKDKLSVGKLIEQGSLTQGMADFLKACVLARLNIVISGGTGSGKTTLLMPSPASFQKTNEFLPLRTRLNYSLNRIMFFASRPSLRIMREKMP